MRLASHALLQWLLALLLVFVSAAGANAQVNVLTTRYDNQRTGANLAETQLNTSNVNSSKFGKLWTYAVDGSVYAQPLYVANVAVPSQGTHNVLYIVTMNDVLYAFDADSSALLWSDDFRNPGAGVTPVPIVDLVTEGAAGAANDLNIVGNIGIESTPQIDLGNNTLYLVARTKEGGAYVQRLHALDITSGAEQPNSPVVIQGSVAGSAAAGSTVSFDPRMQNQRSGLALANGQIFIAWGSHEDQRTYHGWVMSYDETSLVQTGIFCTSCYASGGSEGGIWMGGRAPDVDASGNVYYMTGNGTWDGTNDFGESFVKLGTPNAGLLPVSDWFTPDDWNALNGGDVDLGSCGPMLIPGTGLIVGGGKESLLYLTSTSDMGQETATNAQITQTITVNSGAIGTDRHILGGGPVYWDRSGGTGGKDSWLYIWADNDSVKAYNFNGLTFDNATPPAMPISQGTKASPSYGAGPMTLSANGNTAGSGVLWATLPSTSAGHGVFPGTLYAFDAGNLGNELWSSAGKASDSIGLWPKYSAPTVVNGRVYMASFSGYVSVYGLLPTNTDFLLSAVPSASVAYPGGSQTYTISPAATGGFGGNVSVAVDTLPSGVTASWSSASIPAGGSATLTLTTSSTTPSGSYELSISGTGGSTAHALTLLLVVQPARVVSIKFWGPGCTGMGTAEIAGVVPKAYWNGAMSPNNGNGQRALNDETGAPVGAWATWSAAGGADSVISSITDSADNKRMMRCYLDPVSTGATATISNLPASSAGYDIYVYADGNNGTATRTGAYQISGAGITTTSVNVTDAPNANFSGSFVQADNSAGNYAVFTIGAAASGFTLTATPGATTDTPHAPLNGMQIVPVMAIAPNAPDTPTGVVATAGNASASVTFVAPTNDGGSAITGYTVASSPAGGVDSNAGTTSLSHGITGLSNGTAYTFTVIATNAVGNSVPSAPSNGVTPATVPDAPNAVTATAGNAQATVSFSAPASNGGSAITGYTVTSSPGSFTVTGPSSPLNVPSLSNGTAYAFTVTATNAIGTGPASASSNSVTPATVPDAPNAVTATAGNAQATVSFSAPASNGGSAITGYTVTSSPGSFTVTGPSSPLNVPGLSNGTAYAFTVTATNAIGTGPASASSNSVTPGVAPIITSANATTFTVLSTGTTFIIAASGAPAPTLSVSGTLPGGVTFTPATGMIAGTPVSGSVGSYPLSFTANNGVAPVATQAFILGVAQANQTISFTGPLDQPYTASPIPLVYSASSGLPVTIVSTTPTVCAVSGNALGLLSAGTCTLVATQAGSADYAGAASVTQNTVIMPTLPSAPTITDAVLGNQQVTLSFTPPTNTGGVAVAGYTADCVATSGTVEANGNGSPITVFGLVQSLAYDCAVSANNSVGTGPASAAVHVIPGDLIFANGFD